MVSLGDVGAGGNAAADVGWRAKSEGSAQHMQWLARRSTTVAAAAVAAALAVFDESDALVVSAQSSEPLLKLPTSPTTRSPDAFASSSASASASVAATGKSSAHVVHPRA